MSAKELQPRRLDSLEKNCQYIDKTVKCPPAKPTWDDKVIKMKSFVFRRNKKGQYSIESRSTGKYCGQNFDCNHRASKQFRVVKTAPGADPSNGIFKLFWMNKATGEEQPCGVDKNGRLTCVGQTVAQPFYVEGMRQPHK